MDEIEKMYKNAEIKRRCSLWSRILEMPTTQICEGICENEELCSHCLYGPYKNAYYPPFTAEKQLELIKWLAIKDYGKYTTSLLININSSYVRFSAGLQAGVHCLDVKYDKQSINFENSLAGLVNNLWQDLTEQEKQQIKEILSE